MVVNLLVIWEWWVGMMFMNGNLHAEGVGATRRERRNGPILMRDRRHPALAPDAFQPPALASRVLRPKETVGELFNAPADQAGESRGADAHPGVRGLTA
jgi:hypothetical protein